MDQVIPVTQARKDLLRLVDKIDEEYSRVDLTKNGRVKATLVSPEYLDSLEETIYTLENSMKDIKVAEKDIADGKYVTLEEYIRKFNASKKFSPARKSKKKLK
ncbi:type II toxin-antitoxin system Phd/YefM family antitoxin [Candidatus Gottesmanbacteria bacterium]|nr:type II toxin-antitoxin system Phd/YefM family antitoxin [Candidatus Gottesmanbacteria bacterium]